MQKKLVKRIEKQLRKMGCSRFEKVDTTNWYNPRVYALNVYYIGSNTFKYDEHILSTCGKTKLKAYKMALRLIKLEQDRSFLSQYHLWNCDTEEGYV